MDPGIAALTAGFSNGDFDPEILKWNAEFQWISAKIVGFRCRFLDSHGDLGILVGIMVAAEIPV